MTSSRTGLAALYTALSMAGFATMDAVSKILVRDYPIVQTLWIRYIVFTLFALAVSYRSGIRAPWRSNRPWFQGSRGLLALVENGVFVLAFAYLPLADTHAIAATSPLLVVALSVPLLAERVSADRWLAVFAGFVGVLTILRPGLQTLTWPAFIPLGGALLWALYQIMTRVGSRTDRSEVTLFWTAISGLIGTSLLVQFQWVALTPTAVAMMLCVGILGSLSHFALILALDHAPAATVQPYSYLLLVWATGMGYAVFGDFPDVWTFVGGGIVVLSGLYSWHRDMREAREQ